MDIRQFSDLVREEFGAKMEHATPANMRKFLCRMHLELEGNDPPQGTFIIPREKATNYEQVVAEFLSKVVDFPPEQAVILLWVFSSELFYARLGEQYEEHLSDLLTYDINE